MLSVYKTFTLRYNKVMYVHFDMYTLYKNTAVLYLGSIRKGYKNHEPVIIWK